MGGKPKTTFFFTDSKGRVGWINKMIWHSVLEWGQNAGVVLPLLTFLCTFLLEQLYFCFLISFSFAIYRIFYTWSSSSLLYSKTDFSQLQRVHQWQDRFWFIFIYKVIWSYPLPVFAEVLLSSHPCAKTESRTDDILFLWSWHEWNESCTLWEWLMSM